MTLRAGLAASLRLGYRLEASPVGRAAAAPSGLAAGLQRGWATSWDVRPPTAPIELAELVEGLDPGALRDERVAAAEEHRSSVELDPDDLAVFAAVRGGAEIRAHFAGLPHARECRGRAG